MWIILSIDSIIKKLAPTYNKSTWMALVGAANTCHCSQVNIDVCAKQVDLLSKSTKNIWVFLSNKQSLSNSQKNVNSSSSVLLQQLQVFPKVAMAREEIPSIAVIGFAYSQCSVNVLMETLSLPQHWSFSSVFSLLFTGVWWKDSIPLFCPEYLLPCFPVLLIPRLFNLPSIRPCNW